MCGARTSAWTGLAVLVLAVASGCSEGGGGGPTLGALTDSGYLAQVSTAGGAVALTSGQGPLGFAHVAAIARDPASGTVYGLAASSTVGATVLLRVDPTAGPRGLASAPVVVGEVDAAPSTLAFRTADGMLYGVRSGPSLAPGTLVRVDPQSGARTDVGECPKVTTLTYDAVTDALYGVVGGSFQRIQPDTGAATELFVEGSLLPQLRALAFDPVTGVLHGALLDPTDGPRAAELDLFGSVDDVAALGESLVDLEVDPQTGALLGLGSGGSIVAVTPGATEYAVEHRGNVGLELFDFTHDPADGGYFGVDTTDHLVKFWLGGASRTIGLLDVPTRQLVYDWDVQELWGVGNELIFSSPDLYIYPVDVATAATGTPVLTQLKPGSEVAYDTAFGLLRANRDGGSQPDSFVTLDPGTGSVVAQNAAPSPTLTGLVCDPDTLGFVSAWPAAVSGETNLATSNMSGASDIVLQNIAPFDVTVLEVHPDPATFLGQGPEGDLFAITLGSDGAQRSIGTVKAGFYRGTTWVPALGRVVAVTSDEVWAIDPASGSSERLGSTPSDDTPSGVAWDAERGQLGFLIDDEVRWTGAQSPWLASTTTPLGGLDVQSLAFSPERGVFYLVGDDGLHTLARNETSASLGTVSSTPPPETVRDVTWDAGALWAATSDGRLWRVDPDSGEWSSVGTTRFGLRGLY